MTSFSLFSGTTLYFLLALSFAWYSPFYLCPLLFSFALLSPYSAYFGVLSNFLARFSGLASIAPLPPPSPFHYVMAKIVPVVQLAAHAKSSTLYGRTTKFFRLDGLRLFCIIMGLRWSSAITEKAYLKIASCCGFSATVTFNNKSPLLTPRVNFWTLLHFLRELS